LSELGAWPVVTNARLTAREIEEIRAHCTPRLMLFTHAASPDALRHGLRYRAREISPPGLGPLMAADVDAGSEREPAELARDVAALIYTSGTTGQPKGVMVTHRGLLHYARVTAEIRRMGPEDCAFAVMPMSHIFGLATLLLATFQAGGSLYLVARFNVADACAALQRDAISILQGVPAMFSRILAHLGKTGVTTLHPKRLRYLYRRWSARSRAQAQRRGDVRPAAASRLWHDRIRGLAVHHAHGPAAQRLLCRRDRRRRGVARGGAGWRTRAEGSPESCG
jgi:acyl-CoA synthetase (AMP-forming)/AMP-acid ligase II